MAIAVRMWNFAKAENSTGVPPATPNQTYQCILKEPCSITHPVIKVQLAADANPPLYNYAYIPKFNRYYRVTDWEYNERLWVAYLTVDVLASYKTSIGNSSLYVLRSSNTFDGSVKDTFYPTRADCASEAILATDPLPWWTISADGSTGGCYVVGIISGNNIEYYAQTPASFKKFCAQVLDSTLSNYTGGGTIDITNELAKMIFKPFDYVTSVIYLPVTLSTLYNNGTEPYYIDNYTHSWNIGFWSLSDNDVTLWPLRRSKIFTGYSKTFNLTNHPKAATRGKYLNGPPYTDLYMYLPRIGMIPIDTGITCDASSVRADLSIDLVSGEAIYELYAFKTGYGAGIPLGRYSTQLGVAVQLAQDGLTITNAMNTASSITQSAAAALSSPMDIPGALGSITKLFEPHISQLGNYGGFMDMAVGTCSMVIVTRDVVDDDNTNHGRPLCQTMQLSTIPGFIQVLEGNIAINDAFKEEIAEIKNYLETGFYYE